MSGGDGQRQQQSGIRTVALDAYEKKELTHFLRDLKLCPQNGKVVLHFNGGAVIKVEPQPVL
jgi:hypothetical protein